MYVIKIVFDIFKSNANSVICRNNPIYSSIQHYLNAARSSDLLSATNPTIGVSNGIVGNVLGTLTCIFTRDNMNNATNYFQITPTSSFYILTAFGSGLFISILFDLFKSNSIIKIFYNVF